MKEIGQFEEAKCRYICEIFTVGLPQMRVLVNAKPCTTETS